MIPKIILSIVLLLSFTSPSTDKIVMDKYPINLLTFLDELKNINQYYFEESHREDCFNRAEYNIQEILQHINLKSNLEETEDYFELLEKYQLILAKITFKDKLETTLFLREFVRDFDRLDDVELRLDIFLRLKKRN